MNDGEFCKSCGRTLGICFSIDGYDTVSTDRTRIAFIIVVIQITLRCGDGEGANISRRRDTCPSQRTSTTALQTGTDVIDAWIERDIIDGQIGTGLLGPRLKYKESELVCQTG